MKVDDGDVLLVRPRNGSHLRRPCDRLRFWRCNRRRRRSAGMSSLLAARRRATAISAASALLWWRLWTAIRWLLSPRPRMSAARAGGRPANGTITARSVDDAQSRSASAGAAPTRISVSAGASWPCVMSTVGNRARSWSIWVSERDIGHVAPPNFEPSKICTRSRFNFLEVLLKILRTNL